MSAIYTFGKIHLFSRPMMVFALLCILILSLTLVMLRRRLLSGMVRIVTKNPLLVLGLAAAVTLGALASLPFLKVSTSRSNLLDEDDPYQRQLNRFLRLFGNPNHLIAVVEGGSLADRHKVSDRLADLIHSHPKLYKHVFHKVSLKDMQRQGLLYLPLDELKSLQRIVGEPKGAAERIALFNTINDLPSLLHAVSLLVRASITDKLPAAVSDKQRGQGLKLIEQFFVEMSEWIKDPDRKQILALKRLYMKRFDLSKSNLDQKGYLSDKKSRLYLFIRPAKDSDETKVMLPMVKKARALGVEAARGFKGIKVKFTGYPALLTDEIQIIQKDMFLTTIIALVGIVFIFMLVFRAVRQVILAVVALLVGLLWTVAFTVIAYGGFNLITSLFGAILLGLGIDFGIHINARFNEARAGGANPAEAVEETILGVGPGLLTGGLITAAVFYTTAISEFRAFSELGVIAGTGMIFTLLAALTILPALLMVNPGKVAAVHSASRGKKRAFAARLLIRWPVAILVVGGVCTIAASRSGQPPLDYNLITMMPEKTESRAAYTKMIEESNFKSEFIAIIVNTINEARRVAADLKKHPEVVSRVDHPGQVVPDHQRQKLHIIQQLAAVFRRMKKRYRNLPPLDDKEVRVALSSVADAFREAREAAATTKKTQLRSLQQPLERVHGAIARLRAQLQKPGAMKRMRAFEKRLFGLLEDGITALGEMLHPTKITESSLPPFARERYVGRKNKKYAIYVYPKYSIYDRAFLGLFVNTASRVAGKHKRVATGFPVTYFQHVSLLKEGLMAAAFLAAIAIILLLMLDYTESKWAVLGLVPLAVMAAWSHQMSGWPVAIVFLILMIGIMAVFDGKAVGHMLLALVPTAMGALWMIAMMRVLGIDYNLANIVALPLLLGIGVVYNVHIIHRFRQEKEVDVFQVVRHTGAAVLLSALTTMIGFGAIAASAHQGMRTMGLTMLIGVGTCMISALLVLPAMMRLLPKVRRAEIEGGDGAASTSTPAPTPAAADAEAETQEN